MSQNFEDNEEIQNLIQTAMPTARSAKVPEDGGMKDDVLSLSRHSM